MDSCTVNMSWRDQLLGIQNGLVPGRSPVVSRYPSSLQPMFLGSRPDVSTLWVTTVTDPT